MKILVDSLNHLKSDLANMNQKKLTKTINHEYLHDITPKLNNIVKYIKSDLAAPNIGEEGIVINILNDYIDLLMDNGVEIRLLNSDFNKHFKVVELN